MLEIVRNQRTCYSGSVTVELSRHELDLLDRALVAWQAQPMEKGMTTSLFSAILGRGEQPAIERAETRIKEAGEVCRQRERQALMLRAKLAQVLNAASEHEVPSTVPP